MRRTAIALACSTVFVAVPALAANHEVTVGGSGFVYSPSELTIDVGDTVTFTNAGGFHNVTSDDGAVTSFHCSDACGDAPVGNLSSNLWSSTVTFPDAGTIGYYCEAHGATGGVGMSGVIVVKAAALPVVDVSPGSLSASAEAGTGTTASFDLANSGGATLDWSADTASGDCATPASVAWLTLDPASGSIAAGASATTVDVTFDATGLTAGAYSANICIHSNDAAHDPLTLPVDFTVTPDLIFANGFDG